MVGCTCSVPLNDEYSISGRYKLRTTGIDKCFSRAKRRFIILYLGHIMAKTVVHTPEALIRLHSPATQRDSTYDLKLHRLALQLDSPDLEIDTDCANVAFGVCVVSETKQET